MTLVIVPLPPSHIPFNVPLTNASSGIVTFGPGNNFIEGEPDNQVIIGNTLDITVGGAQGGNNTIYGESGHTSTINDLFTIMGNANMIEGVPGTYAYGGDNIIEAVSPSDPGNDPSNPAYYPGAYDLLIGNAVIMGDYSATWTTPPPSNTFINTIYDDTRATLTVAIGTAQTMNGHVNGGYNYIAGTAYCSQLFGDAVMMNGDSGPGGGPGMFAGHNTIVLDSAGVLSQYPVSDFLSGTNASVAFGDAQYIQGYVQGGNNTIYMSGGGQTVYGDAQTLAAPGFVGGYNTIVCSAVSGAGLPENSIYGDCGMNGNTASGGHNVIDAGGGNSMIYGDCEPNVSTANFTGGFNTINCGTGTNTIWGGLGGNNTFVFAPGSGQDTIMDFDQNGGGMDHLAFNQADGDEIDLTAYPLQAKFGAGGIVVISEGGNSVIDLPSKSSTNLAPSTITLVGVTPQELTLNDFILATTAPAPTPSAPAVTSLTATTDTGGEDLHAGNLVTITVNLNEAATVTGLPILQLNDNEVAGYTGGSGTKTLTFAYALQTGAPGDNVADLQVTGLNLPTGSSIVDSNGNSLASGPVTANLGIQIDTTTVPATSVQQEILGLYAALYGRATDSGGVSYWTGIVGQQPDGAGVTTANAGAAAVTLNDAAVLGQAFVNTQSTYFNSLYGSLNDSAFINAMYVNIGGNAGDPGGIAYWANILAQSEAGGQSVQAARAGLVGQFVHDLVDYNLATATGLTPAQLLAADQRQAAVDNKIAVSLALSNASQQAGGSILVVHTVGDAAYEAATTLIQGVTYDPATVTTAILGINNAVAHQNLSLI